MSRVTLQEPIIVSQWWKNRRHDAITVSLHTYEGTNLVDVRTYTMREGCLVPTPKGVSISVLRLPDLARSINKALAKARELALLPKEGEAS
jgi:hypothetical protein